MEDPIYASYKSQVLQRLGELKADVIPPSWWGTVIQHYYNVGYSVEQAVRAILEVLDTSRKTTRVDE